MLLGAVGDGLDVLATMDTDSFICKILAFHLWRTGFPTNLLMVRYPMECISIIYAETALA